jgi:four helix bundle protein
MKQNILLEKTFGFAVKAVKLTQELQIKNKEYVLSRQFLKSSTSIGANSEEAIAGQSSADFLSKLSIARKEARESLYWLRLITASDLHDCSELINDVNEIIRIITSIIMTTKQREAKT